MVDVNSEGKIDVFFVKECKFFLILIEVMVEVDKFKERVCFLFFSSMILGESIDSGSFVIWLFVKK